MGIGAGTGIAGSAVPPQIHESTTTAFVETHKAALAIVPPDTNQVIPFTQQDTQMFYRYEAKASDPMLTTPNLQIRADIGKENEDTSWKKNYEDLVNSLPTALKDLLVAENNKPFGSRNSQLVVFNNVLMASAKFISWAQTASVPPAPNTPAAMKNELNASLPTIALQGAVTNLGGVLSGVQSQLSQIGGNLVGHDQVANLSNELNKLLPVFNTLTQKSAAGEDVTQSFISLADTTHRLVQQNTMQGTNGQFQILGSILNTLNTLAAASALEHGSPTLLTSSDAASFDNSGALGSIIDQTIRGLQSSSGMREELEELNSLQIKLKALRDG